MCHFLISVDFGLFWLTLVYCLLLVKVDICELFLCGGLFYEYVLRRRMHFVPFSCYAFFNCSVFFKTLKQSVVDINLCIQLPDFFFKLLDFFLLCSTSDEIAVFSNKACYNNEYKYQNKIFESADETQ